MGWQPLPKIAHGVAIYPFTPPQQEHPTSAAHFSVPNVISPSIGTQHADSHSPHIPNSATADLSDIGPADYAAMLPLEVGDDLFIFEQYGKWYRGYVLATLEGGQRPDNAPIGCFPSTHVQIKNYIGQEQNESDNLMTFQSSPLQDRDGLRLDSASVGLEIPALSRSKSEPSAERRQSHDSGTYKPRSRSNSIEYTARHPLPRPIPSLPLERFDQSTLAGSELPLIDEIGACASDWYILLYKYFEDGNYSSFDAVLDQINYLLHARRQLLDQALSMGELHRLKKDVIRDMVTMNLAQQRSMILRHPVDGYLLDVSTVSLPTMFRMHWNYEISYQHSPVNFNHALQNVSSSKSTSVAPVPFLSSVDSDSTPSIHSLGGEFYHLFFELKACVAHICQPGEFMELYFSFFSSTQQKFITDQYVVVLTYNGMPKDESQIDKMQTLFVDLSPNDFDGELYLVCRVMRLGAMKFSEKDYFGSIGSHASFIFGGESHRVLDQDTEGNRLSSGVSSTSRLFRRPFGCGVLSLSRLFGSTAEQGSGQPFIPPGSMGLTRECDINIYTAQSESRFANLHEDIINNNTREITKNSKAEMLCVSMRLFYGQLKQVSKTNASLLQDVTRTDRLGFPDVVFPDDDRNELYIRLMYGDFSQFSRSKNIQVTVCVRDNHTGDVVEDAIGYGTGVPNVTYWESMVFYHEQRPHWNEMLKITIPDARVWESSHVFITVRHKSSQSLVNSASTPMMKLSGDMVPSPLGGSSNDRIVAIGFLPLLLPPSYQDFVADGPHCLHLYKCDRQYIHPSIYLSNLPWSTHLSATNNMAKQESTKAQRTKSGQYGFTPTNSISKATGGVFSSTFFNHSSHSVHSSPSSPVDQPNSKSDSSTAAPAKLSLIKDTITIQTLLCSTKFTQNKTLMKLLNWKSLLDSGCNDGGSELLATLDEFTFTSELEVIKFLVDIFNALLDIMVCQHPSIENREILCDQTLSALMWVLGIVQDRRFSYFRPVVDMYIVKRFRSSDQPDVSKDQRTYDELLQAMKRLCSVPDDPKRAKLLRSSTKVWEYIFRFIMRSRVMQQETEDEGERGLRDFVFKEELQELLSVITHIMDSEQPSSMIGTQALVLQHFGDILNEIWSVFSAKELVNMTKEFVDTCSHVTGKLAGYRLCLILSIVKGPVFNVSTCRFGLAEDVFRWIGVWINSYVSAAKSVLFSPHPDKSTNEQPRSRLPRLKWVENLRLSITIMSEVLEKSRKICGMTPSGLTSASFPLSAHEGTSRPLSMVSMDSDVEYTGEEHLDLQSITQAGLSIVPQILDAYKDLQRLTLRAMQATAVSDRPQSLAMDTQEPFSPRSNPEKSPFKLRERSNTANRINTALASLPTRSTVIGGSVKLQALATSPPIPFPATYPFPSIETNRGERSSSRDNLDAMLVTGLADLTVVMLELFYLTPKEQWTEFLVKKYEQDGPVNTAEFMQHLCHTCMAILFGDNMQLTLEDKGKSDETATDEEDDTTRVSLTLPSQWLNIGVIAHRIILCQILAPATSLFERDDLHSMTDADSNQLESAVFLTWKTFFVSLLRIISSVRLDFDNSPTQDQRATWKLAGDVKGTVGARAMLELWNLAGHYSSRLTNTRIPGIEDGQLELEKALKMASISRQSVPLFEGEYRPPSSDGSILETDILIHPLGMPQTAESSAVDVHDVSSSNYMTSSLQMQLVPANLSSLCAASLTLHDCVRGAAVTIIADIIIADLIMFDNASHVQRQLISTIDRLVMSDKRGNDLIRVRLTQELKHSVEKKLRQRNVVHFAIKGDRVVESVGKYMELLLQIRNLPNNDEFMDERINATLKIMKFIQVIEREEIYIKYVHQLVELHVENQDYVEAALTLRFHADLLKWELQEKMCSIPDLGFDEQSAFERKEMLYVAMMNYLEKGNALEQCIKICKELAYVYEHIVFDYHKLSKILEKHSKFAQDIVNKKRCFSEYFRVGFYGRGFPPGLRNQHFIYRGLEWEKLSSFVERIQNRHPHALLVSGKLAKIPVIEGEPLRELESALDGQYLQITPVTPKPDTEKHPELNNPLMPEDVREYYTANEVSQFTFSRIVAKDSDIVQDGKPEDDFLHLWTELTTLECEETFPSIARRSKIINIYTTQVSPIGNAIKAIEDKTEELEQLEKKYAAYTIRPPSTPVNINPFSMSLNGAVDAPVNGGLPLYKKAFLSEDYWNKNPEMRPFIEKLRNCIDIQTRVIEQCLETHHKLVDSELRPFHDTLVEFFKKNFADEIKRIDTPSSMPTSASSYRRPSSILSTGTTVDSRMTTPRHHSITPMPPISRAFSIHQHSPTLRSPSLAESNNRSSGFYRTFHQIRKKTTRKKTT